MTNMRKKNHLTFRDDLSMFDNFFQSSYDRITFWKVTIDESQFDMEPQKGLQQ